MTPPSPKHVLILHGWQGSGPEHWQRWLAGRLRDAGHVVRFPDLPACDLPCPDRWGVALHDELAALGGAVEDRVVVAHSLGCVLWLREAASLKPEHHVDRVALVAPPCPGAEVRELAKFYPTGAERDPIAAVARETRLICSENDPYCPGTGAAEYWGQRLGLAIDPVPGAAHINIEAGYGPWPEIEAWVLGGVLALTG